MLLVLQALGQLLGERALEPFEVISSPDYEDEIKFMPCQVLRI